MSNTPCPSSLSPHGRHFFPLPKKTCSVCVVKAGVFFVTLWVHIKHGEVQALAKAMRYLICSPLQAAVHQEALHFCQKAGHYCSLKT